jgi:stage III sporulation protein AE
MEYETIINEQLDSMNLNELEEIADGTTVKAIINDLLNGTPLFDSEEIVQNLFDLFMLEIKEAIVLGCEVLSVCIVIGLLTNFSSSFGNKTVYTVGTIVCSCIVIALCIGNFYSSYEYCRESMNTMSSTMLILLPIMIPLLVSMGGISSGSILDPVIIAAVTAFDFIMQHVVLPMVFLSAIFIMINSITEKDYVKKLSAFMRKGSVFVVGFCITIFSGITAVQGILTKSADGILINSAKFSIDNFIPIIGGFAADSLEMVIGCIGLIKNAVGIVGIVAIITVITVPVIKILAIALVYKVIAIVTEPIASKNISDSLNELGNSAIVMTVVLGAGAMMFLLFITVLMGVGGGTLWK